MSLIDLIAPIVFAVLAFGGRAIVIKMRQNGHGEKLDAVHATSLTWQAKSLRTAAAFMRPTSQLLNRTRPKNLPLDATKSTELE